MGIYAETSRGSFILSSRGDVEKIEKLASDFLYYAEGELADDNWNRIPFNYEEEEGEIIFSWEFASAGGYLTGVSLSEVEERLGVEIDINNVHESLEEQDIDWDEFAETCEEIHEENLDAGTQLEFTEEQLEQFRKGLDETEDVLDVNIYERVTQDIVSSCIYETEITVFNDVDDSGRKALNLVFCDTKEHGVENDASDFIGFKNIQDHKEELKRYVLSIGKTLKKTDVIQYNEGFVLSDKRSDTFSIFFEFALTYDVKGKIFLSEESPTDADLHPIYEYFSNLKNT